MKMLFCVVIITCTLCLSLAVLKVMYQGDNSVVLYWCENYDEDNVCLPSALTVELLTRVDNNDSGDDVDDDNGDDNMMKEIRQVVTDVCVHAESFLPTSAGNGGW
jgi:hypothetical protein